jgi:hypothetical protein
MEFIMFNQLVNPAVVATRNPMGSVLPEVILANEVVGDAEKQTIITLAEQFSDGESKELMGVDLKNKAAISLCGLMKRNGVDKAGLPSFAWYNELRSGFVSAYMEYEALEEFQRNTADKAFGRLYERSGFNAIPKATNPKAVQEAERKAKIKQAKDQAVGKALSDSGQDVNQAIANVTAKGDYATLELLIAKAKADNKSSTAEANKTLTPLKDELVKKLRACNNKATLDKIAKLLA